ncbi:cytochrome P450 family protein [Saccharomonospora iraqiensis]|uniref:cytochrome P450 n=1 Tax=Saccharomonospora iraqiensis TaxID=52698 RepID=UPI00022DFC5E|nr:cytochrome P450 [Saccharomonospora iraqiensis]
MSGPHAPPTALYGPGFARDPARLNEDLRRRHGPVAPVLLDGTVPAWLVLGYRELYQVADDPGLFARTRRHWHSGQHVRPQEPIDPRVSRTPGVETVPRSGDRPAAVPGSGAAPPPLHEALAEVDPMELRLRVEQVADRLVNGFAGRGTADLIAGYTHRIPMLTLARIFGLSETTVPGLVRDTGLAATPGPEAGPARQRIVSLMRELVRHRRAHPGADLPSRILAHPRAPHDDAVATDLFLTLEAAHLATADWMGNALRLMLTDERFATTLSGGRGSIGQALNEVLWRDPPVQNIVGRIATTDTHLGGRRVRRGDLLVLGVAAANADPHARVRGACPQVVAGGGGDVGGAVGNEAYLSFGHGEHGCPYPAQEIAATVARGGVEVLLDRLPDVHLAVPTSALAWRHSVRMRGLTTLPVRFTPARPGS